VPKWIYSQGGYFEPKTGGEVRIVRFYNKKQTNKQTNDVTSCFPRTKREVLNITIIHLCEFGVKFLNFGATYLSLGAIYLKVGATYLNFSTTYLNFGQN